MSWADTLLSMAAGGDWWGAILASYTNVLGGFFYMILMAMALTMIYIKTQNFGTTAIVGIMLSSFVLIMAPGISFYGFMMIVILGIAGIIYKIMR